MNEGDQMPEAVTQSVACADNPAAWFAQDFDGNDDWIYRFTHADVNDLVEQFHYKPSTTVEMGIGWFVSWYSDYYKL